MKYKAQHGLIFCVARFQTGFQISLQISGFQIQFGHNASYIATTYQKFYVQGIGKNTKQNYQHFLFNTLNLAAGTAPSQ